MKKILFTLSFLFYFNYSFGLIGVGIDATKINVWRYWEKTDTGYKYKMIIFNISDSSLTFSLEQWGQNDTVRGKYLLKDIFIDKKECKIFDIPFDAQNCFSFYVNKSHIGILCMDSYSYPVNISQNKFISGEGLNGRRCGFWVSKNKLFTDNNATDTLSLLVNYDPKAVLSTDGTFKLEIKPSMDYTSFTGKINNTQTGAFIVREEYKIELPYRAEYNMESNKEISSNQKTDIQIIYSVKVVGKFFLGLYSYSKIETLEKQFNRDKTFFYKMENRRVEMSELPVIVRR